CKRYYHPIFDSPKSAISTHVFTPQSVAVIEMKTTSISACFFVLSILGSSSSAKQSIRSRRSIFIFYSIFLE
ncbi:MAG: hypothetical protein ACI9QD_000634, partial [Thermoproteota archaeon]